MRSSLLILCFLATGNVWADLLEIKCPACRDPHTHPEDYGNFAYNQVFGANPWLTLEEAGKLLITNLDDRYAVVDMDHVLQDTPFSIRIPLLAVDMVVPTDEISIKVFSDTGGLAEYTVHISGLDLIVGPAPPPVQAPYENTTTPGGRRDGSDLNSGGPSPDYDTGGGSGSNSICDADVRNDCIGS